MASSEGLGAELCVAWSEGLLEIVAGTWIPVAGSLRGWPTKAKALTETATASAMPAAPSPMIVSARFT